MSSRRPAPTYAGVRLPPMSGELAYHVVDVLETIIAAICDAYGDDMADYQGRVFPDRPPPSDAEDFVDSPSSDPDDDIPF